MARVSLAFLLTAIVVASAQAQTDDGSDKQAPRDRNSELRTRTWSIYTEGGLSWATDVWYQSIDAKRSYKQSPAVGGGVDFTIRPWVRVGAEYLWSRYRREQRFSTLDTKTMPIKGYGNYLMNYHNAKLGVGLNLMELWPNRPAQWFNIWASTGIGYTFARGNEYDVTFGNTQQGATTSAMGNVRTANHHESFKTFYVPTSLHIEADVSRYITVGVKGEMDWLLNRKDITPKNYVIGLATVRYNFVASRISGLKGHYEGKIDAMNDRMNALRKEVEDAKARAEREAAERQRAERRIADLQRRLSDCEDNKKVEVEEPWHFVQFEHDKSNFSREEGQRLHAFAQTVRGKKLSLVAEASTPGTNGYNQRLSERRLQRVVDALIAEGFPREDLKPSIAIGEQNGKPAAEGRRVTIKVEK